MAITVNMARKHKNQYEVMTQDEKNEWKKNYLISKRKINSDCWEWTGPLVSPRYRYGYTTHNFGEGKKKIMCHRLAYILWKGGIPKNLCVLHQCDNTKCFNPDHLHLGTPQDNTDEMKDRGRERKVEGEKNHKSKLKVEQVFSIRKDFEEGMKHREIAKKYNIGSSTVHYITTGKTWRKI